MPILGRPLAGSAPNITVNLIEPHSVLGDRVNELNMRVGKIFRFGNQVFIPNGQWLTPTSVLSARFAKLSLQLGF